MTRTHPIHPYTTALKIKQIPRVQSSKNCCCRASATNGLCSSQVRRALYPTYSWVGIWGLLESEQNQTEKGKQHTHTDTQTTSQQTNKPTQTPTQVNSCLKKGKKNEPTQANNVEGYSHELDLHGGLSVVPKARSRRGPKTGPAEDLDPHP